ncbi:Uu.00g077940.m01.CDS01 [Anthostomella pinea]|uniref:Uu.00g077940.m01.CDS01 n=1 Tax=Anthostomella pinea TaxID=933095 RepID=A0AAI8VF56_9PEZI|nr:Uu.00g077940.m01.CDS01 [Anthostomella pinea]
MARKLIIGTPYQILTADFDGTSFSLTGSGNKTVGSAPSWLIFKDPNRLYAVNENADDLNLFTLDAASSNPTFASTAVGSSGVVFLEFNADQSRMVGAAYGSGMVDVWDTTATDGSLKLLKQVNVTGPLGPNQEVHHPHQALLDPTGRFFVIPDLGGDAIFVLDGKDDRYEITGNVTLEAGAGPRHGGFITSGDLTFYVIACEISNQVILYQLHYAEDTIKFTEVQKQSTYGPGFPPANATSAAVGELAVASNNKDVYISNRLSGNETDSIAHFTFNSGGTNGSATLHFADTTSSGGLLPRMFSLSMDADESLVFVANQGGDNGLAAFKRCPKSGSLSSTPVATLPSASLVAPELAATPNMGPQFVKELC